MDPNQQSGTGQPEDVVKSLSDLRQPFENSYQATVEEFLQELSETHLSPELFPILKEYLLRKGKRIRPLLCFAGQLLEGKNEPHFSPAMGLELFHNFVLIHDDIIDQASTRRGLPALQAAIAQSLPCSRQRGEHLALILGDILFSKAVEQFSHNSLPGTLLMEFLKLVRETGAGEAEELMDMDRPLEAVTEDKILLTYYFKTTRYTFEAPLQMGALCAGAPPEKCQALARLARPLGLAFQIENDLHEVRENRACLESVALDLKGGVKTLVFQQFYDQASEEEQQLMNSLTQASKVPTESLEDLLPAIRKSSIIPMLEEKTNALFRQASEFADQAEFSPLESRNLQTLITFLRRLSYHSEAGLSSEKK